MSDRATREDDYGYAVADATRARHETPASVATPRNPESRQPPSQPIETGVHPISVEIVLAAALWFLAVTWVSFARGGEVDLDLVVVTFFFAFFFALFLLTASYAIKDQRETGFGEFLKSNVGTATGRMRGRDVLIEITMVPISLALAATAIGLVWIALHKIMARASAALK
jgi:hypothetical protein